MVMRYLRRRKTPKALCLRVKRYLQYVITELPERQIDQSILDQVSVSLRAELLGVRGRPLAGTAARVENGT